MVPARDSRVHLHAQSGLWKRGWTLFYSGVARVERGRAGVGLLIVPQLSRHVLVVTHGGKGSHCCLGLWAEQQCRVPDLLRGPGRCTGECSNRGLHHSARGLQHPRGQRHCYLEGCDREERPLRSEAEWLFVTGLHKEHHVQA